MCCVTGLCFISSIDYIMIVEMKNHVRSYMFARVLVSVRIFYNKYGIKRRYIVNIKTIFSSCVFRYKFLWIVTMKIVYCWYVISSCMFSRENWVLHLIFFFCRSNFSNVGGIVRKIFTEIKQLKTVLNFFCIPSPTKAMPSNFGNSRQS